jgi:hypothetical protein
MLAIAALYSISSRFRSSGVTTAFIWFEIGGISFGRMGGGGWKAIRKQCGHRNGAGLRGGWWRERDGMTAAFTAVLLVDLCAGDFFEEGETIRAAIWCHELVNYVERKERKLLTRSDHCTWAKRI